jgi:hypothetical protein
MNYGLLTSFHIVKSFCLSTIDEQKGECYVEIIFILSLKVRSARLFSFVIVVCETFAGR